MADSDDQAIASTKEQPIAQKLGTKIREAQKAIETLQKIAEMLVHTRTKAGPVSIPSYVVKNAPNAQPESPFCLLPPEIMSMVQDWLPEEYDRVSLALTCKKLAGVYESLKQREDKMLSRRGPTTRLMILTQLLEWMHTKHRLCVCCVRYRTRASKTQWFGDGQTEEKLKSIVRNPDGQAKHRQITKLRKSGSHCPPCAMRMKINAALDEGLCREKLAKLEKILDEHNVMPRPGLGGKSLGLDRQV